MARSTVFVLLVGVAGCAPVELDSQKQKRPGVVDPDGPKFVRSWGGFGEEPGQFREPSSIELDSAGVVIVAGHEHRFQRFTADGELIDTIGQRGVAEGNFRHPHGLAVDRLRGDQIYVGDQENGRLQVFDAQGGFLRQWGDDGFQHIHDVGIDRASGDIFVGDFELHTVRKFTATGELLGEFGGLGVGQGQFDGVWGISTDSAGRVYVGDRWNQRVQILDRAGTFLAEWSGWDDRPFVKPTGVYVDDDDVVYVCDSLAQTIYLFEPDGTALAAWDLQVIYGRPSEPEDVVIDVATGRIYVAEVLAHTVLQLQLP